MTLGRKRLPATMLVIWSLTLLPSAHASSRHDPSASQLSPTADRTNGRIRAALNRVGSADVLVTFDYAPAAAQAQATPTTTLRAALSRMQDQFAALKDPILSSLPTARVLHDYHWLPVSLVRLRSAADLDSLERASGVVQVVQDAESWMTGKPNLDLIRQPEAQAAGFDGAGVSIAVLDTGVDYTRPAFGACASPGPGCRVVYAQDFAIEDGLPDANGHGSNVAGIAAEVAPGANILSLDVFDGVGAWHSDILTAIDWVISNRDTYNIRAMNLSLGASHSYQTAPCADSYAAGAFAAANVAGVIPVVAAGNDALDHETYFTDGISDPACAPSAVAVGAVFDSPVRDLSAVGCEGSKAFADEIWCRSQSGSELYLLAPGIRVQAADSTYTGTSMAAPHVAGAVAVLTAASPAATLDQVISTLESTGPLILDARNGVMIPRLDLLRASTTLEAHVGAAPFVDVGDVEVDEGDAGVAEATFSLALSQAVGVPVAINYRTSAGTATPEGDDFTPIEGSIEIPAGQLAAETTIQVNGDLATEVDETFYLELEQATGAVIGDGLGSGIITDDDAARVPVRVSVEVGRSYGTRGKYFLSHAGVAVAFAVQVSPAKPYRLFRWTLYRRIDGAWTPMATDTTGLGYEGRCRVNLRPTLLGRYALEAQFLGDYIHGPATSKRVYVRVTA